MAKMTFEEFKSKKSVVLNKTLFTYCFYKVDKGFDLVTISKSFHTKVYYYKTHKMELIDIDELSFEEAYEKYCECMESWGFKKFGVIMED